MHQQAELFGERPVASKLRCLYPTCGSLLTESAPEDHEHCVNVDLICPVHGVQLTVSTRR